MTIWTRLLPVQAKRLTTNPIRDINDEAVAQAAAFFVYTAIWLNRFSAQCNSYVKNKTGRSMCCDQSGVEAADSWKILTRKGLHLQLRIAVFAIIGSHPDINPTILRLGQDDPRVQISVIIIIVKPVGR